MKLELFQKNNKKKVSNFLFNLRNKSYVRLQSIKKKKIKLNDHEVWFKKIILLKKNKLFLIKYKKKIVGYVRLAKQLKLTIVSWALLKEYQKKGIAIKALTEATKRKKITYKAVIKRNNIASINLAIRCGFKKKKIKKDIIFFIKKII